MPCCHHQALAIGHLSGLEFLLPSHSPPMSNTGLGMEDSILDPGTALAGVAVPAKPLDCAHTT